MTARPYLFQAQLDADLLPARRQRVVNNGIAAAAAAAVFPGRCRCRCGDCCVCFFGGCCICILSLYRLQKREAGADLVHAHEGAGQGAVSRGVFTLEVARAAVQEGQ